MKKKDTTLKVTENELGELSGMQKKRDDFAIRLGALTYNYECSKAQLMSQIAQSERAQKDAGERLLRSYGLDPNKDTFNIDLTSGEILVLASGQWKPITK